MEVLELADGPHMTAIPNQPPVACTLDRGAARERWQAWLQLKAHLVEAERTEESISITFRGADVTSRLADLVEQERRCCAFVEWDLRSNGDVHTLTVSGDPTGIEAMAAAFGLS